MTKPQSNKDIFTELSKRVIGHDYAKKVLINIINRSKARYYQKYFPFELLESDDDLLPLTNCLLIGDSGTGKTHLVESLSKIMHFPFLKIDATELNPTGASGGIKKDGLIKKIHETAKNFHENDPDRYWSIDGTIDQMIVFVDEVDKLAQKLSSDWNDHVQASFLTLFENKTNCPDVTFIFAGAFTGLDKYGKDKKQSIGFGEKHKSAPGSGDLTQSIVRFGLLPEFVGRLQNIVLLDELTQEAYKEILINTLLPKAKKNLVMLGIHDFDLTSTQVEEMSLTAMQSGLGVRCLQTELQKLLVDVEFGIDLRLGL